MAYRTITRRFTLAGVSALGLLASAAPAYAADEEAADDASSDAIIVTATRREESLQEVPIAVTAVAGEEFEKVGFRGPGDLQFLSPSVQLSVVGGDGIYLRGSGLPSANAGSEQSVGLVVDGVVIGFVDDIQGDMSDVARVEVLRGPQGTQFGKNASAGVVSIITAAPEIGMFSLNAHASFGEHNDINNNLRVNIPLTDNSAARFSVFHQNRSGVFPNVVREDKQLGKTQWGGRAKFLWEPTPDLTINLSADYRNEEKTPNFVKAYVNVGTGFSIGGTQYAPPGLGVVEAGIVPSEDNVEIGEARKGDRTTKTGGVTAQVDYAIGNSNLTSISAWRGMDRILHSPLGGGVEPSLYMTTTYNAQQFSQELRFTSPQNELIEYIAGLYYYRRTSHGDRSLIGKVFGVAEAVYGPGAWIAAGGGVGHSTNTNESIAAFVDGTINISDQFKLIGGLRYTSDSAAADQTTEVLPDVYGFPGSSVIPYQSGKVTNDAVSWRFGGQVIVDPDLMFYATASRGYKGPIVDASAEIINYVDPEYVRSYEFGMKSQWFDRALTFNLTLFQQKFKDFQTNVLNTEITPAGFQLGNAGSERTRGVEVEAIVAPAMGLQISGGLTFLDAEFTDFETSCYSSLAPIPMMPTTNPDGIGGCYTIPGTRTSFTQAAGSPLSNASKWTYKIGTNYVADISNDLVFDLSATWLWRSKFYTNGWDPNSENRSYGTMAASAGIANEDQGWRLGVFARNLFGKYYTGAKQPQSQDAGGYMAVLVPEAVRTAGVTFDVEF